MTNIRTWAALGPAIFTLMLIVVFDPGTGVWVNLVAGTSLLGRAVGGTNMKGSICECNSGWYQRTGKFG